MNEVPLKINETTTYETIMEKKSNWSRGSIDLDKLMAACPVSSNTSNS